MQVTHLMNTNILLSDTHILQLYIEPELRTNRAGSKILNSQPEPPDDRVYEPVGTGVMVKKGEEVGKCHPSCLVQCVLKFFVIIIILHTTY